MPKRAAAWFDKNVQEAAKQSGLTLEIQGSSSLARALLQNGMRGHSGGGVPVAV